MSSVDASLIVDAGQQTDDGTAPSRPLATRLTAWYFATSFLLVLIASAILYWATTNALEWADDQVVQKRMGAVRTLLQDEVPSDALVAHEVSDDNQGPRQIFIRIIIDSEIFAVETPDMSAILPPSSFPDASALRFDIIKRATITLPDERTYRALSVRVPVGAKAGPKEAIIQVATDTSLDAAALAWFRRVLATVVVSALVLCSLIGWQIVRSELEPLRRISTAASNIRLRTLNYRVSTVGLPAELHELADQFNKMLERLESASSGLKQYADNVAHELRTPLHRMLVGTEVALSKDRATEDYREALVSNIEECNRLTRIVQRLLFLARADSGQTAIECQQLDVGNELGIIQTYFDSTAADAGVSLKVECDGNLQLHADRVLFQRAVSNLVSNSIAHTPRGGEVSIQAMDNKDSVSVEVADTGVGIAQEHQSRIFDRFYRTNSVRSVDDNRMGLGLSITRSIVELHGGSISLLSKLREGTKITITFPS